MARTESDQSRRAQCMLVFASAKDLRTENVQKPKQTLANPQLLLVVDTGKGKFSTILSICSF